MKKVKVDVKALARMVISIARKDATSSEIVSLLASAGHKISEHSVRALKAHRTMGHHA